MYPFYAAVQFHILWQDLTHPHIPAISPSSPRAKLYSSELSFAVTATEEMSAGTQPYSCLDLYML